MDIIFKTHLTPSIPKELFELITNYLEKKCNIKIKLIHDIHSSGPKKGTPLDCDISVMCTPPFYWIHENFKNDIELIPMAPIFNDERNKNEPVYFSDIFVNQNNKKIKSINDLNRHIWAFNDTESLSGYYCIKNKPISKKIKMICSGDHIKSLEMVKNNIADITCVDSNLLLFKENKLKKIGTFGPHPIQPFVINKKCKYKNEIINAFKCINSEIQEELNKFNIKYFKEVNEDFYFKKYNIKYLID